MIFNVEDQEYEVVIEKKAQNKHTYIRVKKDLKIYVTTNYFTRDKEIEKLLISNYHSIVDMIKKQRIKNKSNEGFNYLGKKYDIVYVDYTDISLGSEKVFLNKSLDIDKWYKKQAKTLFKKRLDEMYSKYTEHIPYPSLRIRKMTTRWGVCNTKDKVITLNLELIKREVKYLDYVIIHELSHLIEANHSSSFWALVEKNCPNYKQIKQEMKSF